MDCCLVFVCQGGDIEKQAALLAASLRRHITGNVEIIAAIPDYAEVRPPSAATLTFLDRLDVRTEKIVNEVDPSYLIANKISSFGVQTLADQFIFLDSDILCLRDIRDDDAFFAGDFAARLTDFSDLTEQEWQEIYHFHGLDYPVRDQRSLICGEAMPLCFNSGVISTNSPKLLKKSWIAHAKALNRPALFPKTRPFLDQISLPMAVNELKLTVTLLSSRHHCSAPLSLLNVFDLPFFVHYYENFHLLGDELLSRVASSLFDEFYGLQELMLGDEFLSLIPSGKNTD